MKPLIKNSLIVILLYGTTIYLPSCNKEVTLPVVETTDISDITLTSALITGAVKDDGGAEITEVGIFFEAQHLSEINLVLSPNGSFTSILTGLKDNTTYYVRAYATNSAGTAYGNEISFTTGPAQAATVKTVAIASVYSTSAVSGVEILSKGGPDVITVGVCWSVIENPTIEVNDQVYIDSEYGGGMGAVIVYLSHLNPGTTYYVRAFANNSAGTVYGDQLSFRTDAEGINPIIFNPELTYGSVSDIDGNTYKTIQIGSQIWMAENLRTTKYNDGVPIDNVASFTEWSGLTTGAYCWYGDNASSYKDIYGGLYNWYAVSTGKLCPTGWHVPINAEWSALSTYLGADAGAMVKENGTSHWLGPNTGATNTSGFTALPGGSRSVYHPFGNPGFGFEDWNSIYSEAYWWSVPDDELDSPYYQSVSWAGNRIYNISGPKQSGLSIRCVKDI